MLPSSSGWKMEAAWSSETFVNIYQTTWHHIPETEIFIVIVGFQILTAVVTKSSIFCDTMLCSPLKVN
jgi:hypothetical protein